MGAVQVLVLCVLTVWLKQGSSLPIVKRAASAPTHWMSQNGMSYDDSLKRSLGLVQSMDSMLVKHVKEVQLESNEVEAKASEGNMRIKLLLTGLKQLKEKNVPAVAADNQTAVAADNQTAVAADNQTAVAADNQTAVAADNQTAVAADNQTAVAADNQTAVAADNQTALLTPSLSGSPATLRRTHFSCLYAGFRFGHYPKFLSMDEGGNVDR
ncbi:uncharacterized protein ACNS7B_016197 [Menidia menidia]